MAWASHSQYLHDLLGVKRGKLGGAKIEGETSSLLRLENKVHLMIPNKWCGFFLLRAN
jgi:hypothetical protein